MSRPTRTNSENHGPRLMDTSERKSVYLHSGRNGAQIRLSPAAFHLLEEVRLGASFESLAEILSRQEERAVKQEEVAAAYDRIASRISEIEERAAQPHGLFWFRRRLLPESWVQRIASYGAFAFHPAVAIVLVAIVLAGAVVALRCGLKVQSGHLLAGYALFFVALLAHELGHASACARYGAKPSEIGFTCYLMYPAFYSNVSAAWELRRWQRVVVDVGGVYFELACGALFAFAYALSGWEPLRVTVVLIVGSCLFSLNPLLKLDGYWLVADALGVTNLGQKPALLFAHARARFRGEKVEPLPWPASVIWMLSVYSVLIVGFWTCFLWMLLPALVHEVREYPALLRTFGVGLLPSRPWPGLAATEALGASTYILVFVSVMLRRLATQAFQLAKRHFSTSVSGRARDAMPPASRSPGRAP
jgi:putative peptide zinc metalloprotease protein